jgi:hypothetical protein
MTNIPHNPGEDPIGEFADTARKIEALKAEVIAVLGQGAIEGELTANETVAEASRVIIGALTEMAGLLRWGDNREAPGNQADAGQIAESGEAEQVSSQAVRVTPAMLPQRRSELIDTSQDVSLTDEELDAYLDDFLDRSSGEEVHLQSILRTIVGDSRLDTRGYRYILGRLDNDSSVTRIGTKRYRIIQGRQPSASREFPQPELWDENVEFEPSRLLTYPEEKVDVSTDGSFEVEEPDFEDIDNSEAMTDEELIGMIARFMGRRPYFTGNELREHLLKNKAVPPEEISGNKIHEFIAEFMMYVDEYYFDKGDEVIWTDSSTDLNAVRQAMGGRTPRVKTYVLGFKPRTVTKVGKRFIPVRPTVAANEVDVEEVEVQETEGQHEREISRDQVQIVVDVVASIGDTMKQRSLIEILTDPDDLNLAEEEAREWIRAAISDGVLFRKPIGGYRGVTLDPPEKQKPVPEAVDTHSIEYVEKEVEKYSRVVDYVMNSLIGLKEAGMGLRYDRLWQGAGMGDDMTFEEFKDFVRRMEDDGFVSIPTNVKLSAHRRTIRGSKVTFPNFEIRRQWKADPNQVLSTARDKALDRLIK